MVINYTGEITGLLKILAYRSDVMTLERERKRESRKPRKFFGKNLSSLAVLTAENDIDLGTYISHSALANGHVKVFHATLNDKPIVPI